MCTINPVIPQSGRVDLLLSNQSGSCPSFHFFRMLANLFMKETCAIGKHIYSTHDHTERHMKQGNHIRKRDDLKRSKKTSLWINSKIKKHDWIFPGVMRSKSQRCSLYHCLSGIHRKVRDVHCIALLVVSTVRWTEGWGLCTGKNRAKATSPSLCFSLWKPSVSWLHETMHSTHRVRTWKD